MRYTGAIFDMDGILFDTEKVFQGVWHEIAEEHGIELEANFMRTIAGSTGQRMREIVERFYHVSDGSAIIDECMTRVIRKLAIDVPMKTGVHEILKSLKEKGLKLAVASSSTKEQIVANLRKTGTYAYFDAIVSGTEVKNGKPAPDIFLLAAEMIACEPEACYVFEDSENGVRAGHASGCTTIMIPDLVEPTEEIRGLCDAVCVDFWDVMANITN